MNITAQYLEALKRCDDWLTVSEWAVRVGELYPELLAKAEIEAANQSTDTTGLREIAARISSSISRGAYVDHIEIDTSERPRKVRYVSSEQHEAAIGSEVEDDIAPIRRDDIIRQAVQSMGNSEKYRIEEFDAISRQLKRFFGLDFEVDHAQALLNKIQPGPHHPDNLQLILKAHNGRKNNNNWVRFSLEEQIRYIESVIEMQKIVASRMGVEMTEDVLGSLIERLKSIYG
ncbi:MAG: hypothetical protein ABW101_18915 [Candidatus Thiodiazotropha sp.]